MESWAGRPQAGSLVKTVVVVRERGDGYQSVITLGKTVGDSSATRSGSHEFPKPLGFVAWSVA